MTFCTICFDAVSYVRRVADLLTQCRSFTKSDGVFKALVTAEQPLPLKFWITPFAKCLPNKNCNAAECFDTCIAKEEIIIPLFLCSQGPSSAVTIRPNDRHLCDKSRIYYTDEKMTIKTVFYNDDEALSALLESKHLSLVKKLVFLDGGYGHYDEDKQVVPSVWRSNGQQPPCVHPKCIGAANADVGIAAPGSDGSEDEEAYEMQVQEVLLQAAQIENNDGE